ncbi:fasciclin domain-containing protein [Pelagicoccus sp. SDUM812002]|uniref:fasciclin domain-containing protein n=1 Tax=Pelagicoccus sp. SDUM812002 TaxID=3041266 RepID=UPI00280E9D3E|nr:fasciclin domain-containing protein [Pelagicoccus sp. SDUM812002]MDQ8188400.1 fasciclin domain-containing protein [Pelagicoccus sp. SDUM812002]
MTFRKPLQLIALLTASALAFSFASAGTYKDKKASKDLVGVAAAADDFSTLVAAVKAADLVGVLQGEGPYTIFAPTNAAFAALPEGTLESLLKPENKDKLVSILTYHVVPAKVMAKDVAAGMVDTANGTQLKIAVNGGSVMVQDANVVATDIMASNGIIHVIDKVMIPEA